MAVNETIVTGRKFRKLIDKANKQWQRISFWHKASDCEFDDGDTAETKVGAIKGITSDLNTTETGYAADMTTVAELNSSLVSDIYVGDDGKLHKTKGGADTVLNFNGSASYPEFTLYSNSNVIIPVNGNTLSFDMQTLHPYVNFYVDKKVNEVYTNLFTQNAGGNYTGTKSFDISGGDAVRFRTVTYDNYGDVGRVSVSNIKIS